jgi:hypothetical protein
LEYTDFLKEVAKVKSPEAQMLPGKIKQLGLAPFQTIQLSPDVKTPMVENDIMDESTAVRSPQPHISHAFNHNHIQEGLCLSNKKLLLQRRFSHISTQIFTDKILLTDPLSNNTPSDPSVKTLTYECILRTKKIDFDVNI